MKLDTQPVRWVCWVALLLTLAGCDGWTKGETVTDPVGMPALHTVCLGRHLVDLPEELGLRGDVDLYYGLGKDFKTVKVRVLQVKGEATGLSSASVFKKDKPEDIEAKMLAVAQSTSYATDPLQKSKGTCIGPLVIDAGQDGERFSLGTRGTKHTDLTLEITINSMLAETDGGLLKRVDSKAGVLAKLGGMASTLRRGKVSIAGRPAEELIDEIKEEDKTVRLFVAETLLTKPSTFAEPRIHIEMSQGGQIQTGPNESAYIDPSISKKDSLAMWDAIIKSIRLRPGSV